MKWKLSLPESPMLVYYFAKLFGLAPFTVGNGGFHPPTLLKTVIIGTAIRHSISIASALPVLIISLLWYKKISHILNKLCDINNELKSLDIEEDSGKFFKNVLITTVITNTILVTICALLNFVASHWPVLFTIQHAINCLLKFNAFLIFSNMLLFVKERFKLLNKELYDVFGPTSHRRSLHRLPIFALCGNPHEEIEASIENLTDLERIRKIELLHLELCDLVDRMANLFAIPILLNSLQNITELMMFCFKIYFISRNSGELRSTKEIVSIISLIMRCLLKIFIAISQLFPMTYASVTTCREGNATKAVLSKVWGKLKSQDLEDEFSMFSFQLLHTPITISIFKFFHLDYSYLYKIFCAVVAYLIIMIQFDTLQPNLST